VKSGNSVSSKRKERENENSQRILLEHGRRLSGVDPGRGDLLERGPHGPREQSRERRRSYRHCFGFHRTARSDRAGQPRHRLPEAGRRGRGRSVFRPSSSGGVHNPSGRRHHQVAPRVRPLRTDKES